jgi:prepilin-type N-terminal cleavage/methylation domain-containing protein
MDLEHQHDLLGRASRLASRGPLPERARGAQGFSLIEVLIASAIFLIVALGIVPFFSQAIVNNRAGADFTQSTNYAKSELERLYSLPFSSPDLQVTAGTEAVTVQYYSQLDKKWETTLATTGDVALWTRTVTIRNFGLGGMIDIDHDGKLDGPLSAGTPVASVHAKQIEIRVQSGRAGGPLGAGKQITLSVFKAY